MREDVVRQESVDRHTAGARGHQQRLAAVPLTAVRLALHLDNFELHTIRALEKADPPASARHHLL